MADISPLGFDPSQVEDMGGGFKVIPPGTYNVVIVESDVMITAKGGKMLVLTYQIIDGQHVGDTVTDRINIVNANELAQKIGLSHLKNICDAIGFAGQLKDSNQLHGKPLAIKVAIEEFESNKEAGKMLQSNKVEKRMKRQNGTATAAAATNTQQPAPQPAAAMGWM